MPTMTFDQAYKLTNNSAEAWLLRHLSYWGPKAKAKRGDHKYVVRTIREFIDDFDCALSERTLKRALASLLKKGIIDKFQSSHPFRKGMVRSTWLRIVSLTVKGANVSPSKVPDCPLPKGQDVPFHITEGVTVGVTEGNMDEATPVPEKPTPVKPMVLGNMTADELKDKFKPKKPKKSGKPMGPAKLLELLRAIQAEADPAHPFGDATGKTMGNCKTILTRFREKDVNDEVIDLTLTTVLDRWGDFRQYLESHAAKKNMPEFATIPVLTTHVSNMLSFVALYSSEAGEEGDEDFFTDAANVKL